MAVVGSAYVVVRAITDKLQADISRAVNQAGRNVRRDGAGLGQSLGAGISDGVDSSGLDARLQQRFRGAVLLGGSAAAEAAGDAGRGIARGMADAVQEGTQGVVNAAGNAGDNAGRTFSRRFGRGISRAGDGLFRIVTRIIALGTILAVAAGGISALVSGLFALSSAASTAAASLIVLPSLFAALAQGAVGAVLAFGGIGEAVKAGTQAQTRAAGVAQDTARQEMLAARQVRDARERLADTYEDSAQRMIDANEALLESRERLRDAEEAAAEAHDDIDDAREEAAERIQQLGFALRQAAIDEREAMRNYQEAQQSYARALLQPIEFDPEMTEEERLQITIRRRAEAQEALEQAQLTAERAADRHSDLAREEAESSRKGVEGSDEVVAAREREAEAIERVAEAEEDLADARKNIGEVERDNARAIRDARRAVADAIFNQRNATNAATTAANNYEQAMSRLSPEAQRFVKFLIGLRPEIDRLRAAAGRELFPKLETAIQNLVNNFFPAFRKSLVDTGGALGSAAISISNSIVRMTQDGDFSTISDSNAQSIRRLGRATGFLTEGLGSILAAAAPLIDRFTKFLVVQSKVFAQWADSRQDSGGMADTFERAGDVAAQLGRIIVNLGGGIRDLARIARPAGQGLLDSFEEATERFRTMFDDKGKAKELRKDFEVIADNVRAISDLAVTLGGVLFRLGTQPGVANVSKQLEELLLNLEPLLNRMINEFGPALTQLADTIFLIFEEMAEAGGFEIALGIFQTVADVALAIIRTDIGKYLLATLIAFKALRAVGRFTGIASLAKLAGRSTLWRSFTAGLRGSNKELSLMGRVGAKAGTALRTGLTKGFEVATGAAKSVGSKIASGLSIGIRSGARGASNAAGFITSRVRDRMKGDGGFVNVTGKGYASRFAAGIKSGARAVGTAASTLAKRVGGVLTRGLSVLTKLTGPLAKGLRVVGVAFRFMLGPVGLIITGIALLVAGAILLYKKNETFRKFVDTKLVPALKRIGEFFADVIWPAIKRVIGIIIKLYATYFKALIASVKKVIGWFGDLIDAVKDFAGDAIDFVKDFVNFFKSLPGKIANAAKGIFNWLEDAIDDAIDWISDLVSDIVGFFKSLPGKVANAAKGIWDWWYDANKKAHAAIKDLVDDVVNFVKGLPGKLFNAGKSMWKWWDDLNDKARDKVRDFLVKIVDFVRGLPDRLANAAKNMWSWISDKWEAMRSSMATKVSNFIEFIKGMPGRFVGGIRNFWGFISEQWTSMREAINSKVQSLIEKVRGIPGALAAAGRGMWTFLISGLISAANKAINGLNALIRRVNKLPGVEIGFIPKLPELADGGEIVRGPGNRVLPLASGGTVKATNGGVLAIIGEGGQNERVTPLDSSGLSRGERAILAALKELAANGGQVYAPQITVHGQAQPRQTAQEILLAQRRNVLNQNFMWNS